MQMKLGIQCALLVTVQAVLFASGEQRSGPTYEDFAGTEVVWEKPANVKGVLFVAHGCNHGAVDFWYRSEQCPKCIGLPEEVNITRTALARGYAVIAISSQARASHRCWHLMLRAHNNGQESHDTRQVKHILSTLIAREGLQGLPVYALGASSGGAFVLALATAMDALAGVCAQIMGVPPEFLEAHISKARSSSSGSSRVYPPTMFVHMPRDKFTAGMVAADIDTLKHQGVPVAEVQVQPSPLTPTWLSTCCSPEINESMSQAIYQAFKANDLIDEQGLLLANPRTTNWRDVLKQAQIPGLDGVRMTPDESAISEELNLLFAGHEIVSSTTAQMLEWFEQQQQQHQQQQQQQH